jgi:hypothetical protein
MTVIGVLILSSVLFCLFLTGLIVNARLSLRAMAKQMDIAMNAAHNGSLGTAVGTVADVVNRGFAKVVIHLICGLGLIISAIVALACMFIYLSSHTGG